MARLSDTVRCGEEALQKSNRPTQATGEGTLSSLLKAESAESTNLRDFPILSQIHAEVGTMPSVVDQINHNSDFIHDRAPSPPATETTAAPHETAPAQAASTAPQQTAPPPQPAQPAPTAAPAQQTPHAEPAPAVAPASPAPSPASDVSEEAINAMYDRLDAFVEGVKAYLQVSQVVDTAGATDVLYRRAIYTRESSDADQGFAATAVLHSVNACIYAIKIGEVVQFDRDQLIDLGVAGLDHDVGMVRLPAEFFTNDQSTGIRHRRRHAHRISEVVARSLNSANKQLQEST
ncbi:TPA: hypothetical protein DCE37_11335 [Candidatus Latescibacteria bacterium]|nr:hypothetical protein [Candidatus Latescibacterota bacterium]